MKGLAAYARQDESIKYKDTMSNPLNNGVSQMHRNDTSYRPNSRRSIERETDMARNEQHGGLVPVLAPMQQLAHAKKPDDDWTGLKNRAERKKRQTRLNVRAYRQRKANAARNPAAAPSTPSIPQQSLFEDASVAYVTTLLSTVLSHTIPSASLLPAHLPLAHRLFPLSSDHLIPLIEYNVYRASLTNIHIMSLYTLLGNPACAHLHNPEPPLFPRVAPSSGIPESLRPTELQRTTPHDLWIDILPHPAMRDNAIRAVEEGRLHQAELCADLLRGLCGGSEAEGALGQAARAAMGRSDEAHEEEARLIVWTTPWETGGWEATLGFVKKYRYLLRGAESLISSTNRWREARGDDPLVWDME